MLNPGKFTGHKAPGRKKKESRNRKINRVDRSSGPLRFSNRSKKSAGGATSSKKSGKLRSGNRRIRPSGNALRESIGNASGSKGNWMVRLESAAGSLEKSQRGTTGKIFRIIVPMFALAALGFGGYYAYRFVMTSPHFEVAQVEFAPTQRVSKNDLLKLSGLSSRPNIFTLDLGALERRLVKHQWVNSAKASRRLPSKIYVDIKEETPAAVVLLDSLYLINPQGKIFKRALQEEALDLTLITGINRSEYKSAPVKSEKRFAEALSILEKYNRKKRPPLGEIHLSEERGVVLYTREKGVEIRIGKGSVDTKLLRLDAVFTALGRRSGNLRIVHLDNRARPERITVRLAEADLDTGTEAVDDDDGSTDG